MKGVTPYQFEVLQRIREVETRHRAPADLDQILELLSWMPTKASVQFTIRAMVTKRLIRKGSTELRRGRKRVIYHMEPLGEQALDPRRVVEELPGSAEAESFIPEEIPSSFREVLEG